jgi:hypothetical protein
MNGFPVSTPPIGEPAVLDKPLANATHERFAQHYAAHGNASRAYRQTYRVKRSTGSLIVTKNSYALRHLPAVAARIRALQALAARTTIIDIRSRMELLQRVIEADPSEVISIVDGRVHVAPSDDWSANSRALVKSIRQRANGEIEVRFHDKLLASDQLNRMQGVYVEKTLNVNASMQIPPLTSMSREDIHALLDSIKPVAS